MLGLTWLSWFIVLFLIFLGKALYESFYKIGPIELGLIEKMFSFKKLEDSVISLNGAPGYQPDILTAGIRFKLWPIFKVTKHPIPQTPTDSKGLVIAQVGAPILQGMKSGEYKESFKSFTDVKAFIRDGGQKGPQRWVLGPGQTHLIHPIAFLVITNENVFGIPLAPNLRKLYDKKTLSFADFELSKEDLEMLRIPLRAVPEDKAEALPEGAKAKEEDTKAKEIEARMREPQDVIGIVTTLDGEPLPNDAIACRLHGFDDIKAKEADWSSAHAADMGGLTLKDIQDFHAELVKMVFESRCGNHNSYQDFQKFIDNGGKMGPQHDVILQGAYNFHPELIDVQEAPMLVVPPGYVAVIKANIGLPTEDISTLVKEKVGILEAIRNAQQGSEQGDERFKFGAIVRPGHIGIWAIVLGPGKYPVNPHLYKAEIIPTSVITLNLSELESKAHDLDEELSTINANSKEGFLFKIDLQVLIHVPPEVAPLVIAQFGTMKILVEEVLEPAIGNYFRDRLQSLPAMKFIEDRQQIGQDALAYMKSRLAPYGVTVLEVYVQNVVLPDELTKVLKAKEVAVQQKGQFEAEEKAETARVDKEKAKGIADSQSDLAKSEVGIETSKNKALARMEQAKGDSDYERKVAAAKQGGIAEGIEELTKSLGREGAALVRTVQVAGEEHLELPRVLVLDGKNGSFAGLIAETMGMLQTKQAGEGGGAATAPVTGQKEN